MSAYGDLAARWDAALMTNYGTPSIALVRGQGAHVWDADGTEYVDLLAGIAVSTLGHAHPAVVDAVTRQIGTLGHVSNLALTPLVVELAERLGALLGAPETRALFCNSGAEANEAALKIARRHHPDRRHVVAAEGAFHGRTLGALSITGQPAKRAPFEPLLGPVTFVPYGDAAALREAVTADTMAVFLEPVMGEAGVVVPPAGYLRAAREACDTTGALLVLDEVQGAVGRTGTWFAHHHPYFGSPVVPDVVTLAKGLAGGLPIGAVLGVGAAGRALQKGDHGSTFAGGPVVSAAALAVLDTIEKDGLLDHVTTLGERFTTATAALDAPLLAGTRGLGLWQALLLREPVAADVERRAREAGFLVNAAAPDVIRLAPPLVLEPTDLDRFLTELPGLLS